MLACGCLGQACCWYRVFQCCGCIEDTSQSHVQIEKQATPPLHAITEATNSPNPFLSTGAPKGPYFESAYKV